MRNRTAIRWARNPLLAVLLLVAFCTRALIPAGFMPGPGGLVICHGYTLALGAASRAMTHDMAAVGMDMAGMEMPHLMSHSSKDGGAPEHEGSNPCPFAAAATTMASGHIAVFLVAVHSVAQNIQLPPQPFIPRGTIVPTRLPRGPPAFA